MSKLRGGLRPSPLKRSPVTTRPKNRLLAALPSKDFERLRPFLKTVPIRPRQVLHRPGQQIRALYFLNGGTASIVTGLSDGTMVEAATVGDEGVLGIEALLSDDAVSIGTTLIQVPNTDAEMLSTAALWRELRKHGALETLMRRYLKVTLAQMMQTTACNARHSVQQRCARWLLTTHDRMHRREFTLSHEFLAFMLGVQRQSVSVVAAGLQKAGFIRYTHGRVTMINRRKLEREACECYAIVRAQFRRLRGVSE